MTTLPYNKFSKESICEYANKLVGMSFREVLKNNSEISDSDKIKLYKYYNKVGSKGSLGNLIEEHYFLYKPNSEKKADFSETGIELKVTPYKILKNRNSFC